MPDPYLAKPKRGLVIGQFMPPHLGHAYLGDFARRYADELAILVCSLPSDPIPGAQRVAWMREMFPGTRVLDGAGLALPQVGDPAAHWRSAVAKRHPEPVDILFASEAYGHRLASSLGARFVPVDVPHATFPVTSDDIRADPYGNWRFIPGAVRPHYLKRVTLFGAESSGKSTLGQALARHYDTIMAPEFGRFHTQAFGQNADTPEDMRQIVMGHLAGRAAAEPHANRVLIEDTDPVLTAIWSDVLCHGRDPWFNAYADYPDLYLLCDIDIPWERDAVRYFADPAARRRFHEACERELIARKAPYLLLKGGREERLAAAVAAIDGLIRP
jgi:NadR type nicotinamide-nucleotide adenylyltransferase